MTGTADFSECGTYRYGLTRRWSNGPTVLWLMLNPSTADAHVLDPTIRRCVGFSQRWGYAGLEVANLFALRSTDPALLYGRDRDPVGPRNDAAIIAAARRCHRIVFAWGTHGRHMGRGAVVIDLIRRLDLQPVCLGVTKDGHPKHPLYLPSDTQPHRFLVPWDQTAADPKAELLAPPEAAS